VNDHVSGAGPKNISEIFTQSLLSGLDNRVSVLKRKKVKTAEKEQN
jgi:hypothetical protein